MAAVGPLIAARDYGTIAELVQSNTQGGHLSHLEVIDGRVEVDDRERPRLLFNPSNDAWFGKWGPPQHLAQARMRAIEEGLPVLRSTTSGISGVIDAHGVVRQSLGTGEAGRIDTMIPRALPPTLFASLGNMLGLCWAALFLLLAVVAMRRQPR